jgi:hypothetical protein
MNLNSNIRRKIKHLTHSSCPEHKKEIVSKIGKFISSQENKIYLDRNQNELNGETNDGLNYDNYFDDELDAPKESENKVLSLNDCQNFRKNSSVGIQKVSFDEKGKIFKPLDESDEEEIFFDLNESEEKNFVNNNDEYELIKASSYENSQFEFQKTRANSILRTLEAGCKNFRMDDD